VRLLSLGEGGGLVDLRRKAECSKILFFFFYLFPEGVADRWQSHTTNPQIDRSQTQNFKLTTVAKMLVPEELLWPWRLRLCAAM
jgi:hypothetical protein